MQTEIPAWLGWDFKGVLCALITAVFCAKKKRVGGDQHASIVFDRKATTSFVVDELPLQVQPIPLLRMSLAQEQQ
jgi:hypothetical protein